jgi:RNA polymerase sigma-70 factor (ECF subfamily)
VKDPWEAERDPLAALRRGDPAPFEAYVRAESATLVGFFRRLGAGTQEAEDLAQDTLLKMFHAAQSYRPRERFEAYAMRVARNAWIDSRRRAAVRPAPASGGLEAEDPSVPEPVSSHAGPEAQAESAERGERLEAAVAALPEHHRLVFDLGVVQGLGYPEIADLLGIPVGTVKSRMFHAVRRLRASLGDVEPEVAPERVRGVAPEAPATEERA